MLAPVDGLTACTWTRIECAGTCGEYDILLPDEPYAPSGTCQCPYCDSHAFVTGRAHGATSRDLPYISPPRYPSGKKRPKSGKHRGGRRKVREAVTVGTG